MRQNRTICVFRMSFACTATLSSPLSFTFSIHVMKAFCRHRLENAFRLYVKMSFGMIFAIAQSSQGTSSLSLKSMGPFIVAIFLPSCTQCVGLSKRKQRIYAMYIHCVWVTSTSVWIFQLFFALNFTVDHIRSFFPSVEWNHFGSLAMLYGMCLFFVAFVHIHTQKKSNLFFFCFVSFDLLKTIPLNADYLFSWAFFHSVRFFFFVHPILSGIEKISK